jgi:hypothetical protein
MEPTKSADFMGTEYRRRSTSTEQVAPIFRTQLLGKLLPAVPVFHALSTFTELNYSNALKSTTIVRTTIVALLFWRLWQGVVKHLRQRGPPCLAEKLPFRSL